MDLDLLNYEKLVRQALHGVLREVLRSVSKNGLPGNHHFFIKFRTYYPGILLSEELRRDYPTEMTIVLQYQFFDLQVEQDTFSVTLSFNNISERLTIPYEAIITFFDPAVNFVLPLHLDTSEVSEPQHRSNEKEEKYGEVVTLDTFRKGKQNKEKE